jgi:hypothetical protein
MPSKNKIKTVGLPPRITSGVLHPVKDKLGLKSSGIYIIPYECSKVYIGQTGKSIYTRIREHHCHI